MKKTNKKLNNKGFSLVELIIVIAIMAILVGVLSPQLMKYIEKSRYAADCQTIDSAYTALKIAMADETAYAAAPSGATESFKAIVGKTGTYAAAGTNEAYADEVIEIFGASDVKFKSKAFSGEDIKCDFSTTGTVKVHVDSKATDTTTYPAVDLPN